MRMIFVTSDLIFQVGAETSLYRAETIANSMANEKLLQSRRCRAEAHLLRAGAALHINF